MERIKLGKWQKIVFVKPLLRELYRLADGVELNKLRVIHSQERWLSEIYWSLGTKGARMESVTVLIEDPHVLSVIQESLEGLIESVEQVDAEVWAF